MKEREAKILSHVRKELKLSDADWFMGSVISPAIGNKSATEKTVLKAGSQLQITTA